MIKVIENQFHMEFRRAIEAIIHFATDSGENMCAHVAA